MFQRRLKVLLFFMLLMGALLTLRAAEFNGSSAITGGPKPPI